MSRKRFSHYSIPSPPFLRRQSEEGDIAEMLIAVFEEWPFKDAVFKWVTEGGLTTFQLQFIWVLRAIYGPEGNIIREFDNAAMFEAVDDANQVTIIPDTELRYDVERILDYKFTEPNDQGFQFRVKWEGDPEFIWEPAKELEGGVAYDAYVVYNDISKLLRKRKCGRLRKLMTAGAVFGG